jgi:uncharacterized protein (TIGR03118 family)
MHRRLATAVAVAAVLAAVPVASQASSQNHGLGTSAFVHQTNLVSDVPGLAQTTDPNLVNAWGITSSSTSPFWVADNGTGVSTLYNGAGQPFPLASPLVVTIPPPAGSAPGTTSAPTGTVFNGSSDFVVSSGGHSGPSRFIFDTEDGTISGWSPTVDATHAILAVDNSASGAIYKGLALGSTATGNFLYATNFHAGTVDVFDKNFAPATLSPGAFTDPLLPAGFAPFGIANIGGQLYVTYAKQDADAEDDVAGRGNGFVDVFDTSGTLVRRFASGAPLNSPWGLAVAPATWGRIAGDVLVGNFGDGAINVFDPATGDWRGGLRSDSGGPLTIDGLWGLRFGNGGNGGDPNTLFFTAGPDDEQHGLFGSLTQTGPPEEEDGD